MGCHDFGFMFRFSFVVPDAWVPACSQIILANCSLCLLSLCSFSFSVGFSQSSRQALPAFFLLKPSDMTAGQALKDRHLPLLHAAEFLFVLWLSLQSLGNVFLRSDPTSAQSLLSFPSGPLLTPCLLSFVGKQVEAISRSAVVWSLWDY